MATVESSSYDRSESVRREQELREIQEALRGLQFGSIHVVVQDGIVVQIDRTDKRRLRPTGPGTGSK